MQEPEKIPEKIQAKLKEVGLWDVNPLNLFRITWKNEAKEKGGLFQAVPNLSLIHIFGNYASDEELNQALNDAVDNGQITQADADAAHQQ